MATVLMQRLASCLKRPATLLSTALLLSACATPPGTAPATVGSRALPSVPKTSSAAPKEPDPFGTLVSQQSRLYRIAAPLLTKNTTLCKGYARNLIGFSAKNQYSYPTEYRGQAQKLLGLD